MRSSNDLTRNALLDKLCGSVNERFTAGADKFMAVFVRPGESRQEAEARTVGDGLYGAAAMYTLIIDTDPQPKTEAELDAEIEEIIKDLKSKGVSDAEIRQALED
jgi:hypothetical protein